MDTKERAPLYLCLWSIALPLAIVLSVAVCILYGNTPLASQAHLPLEALRATTIFATVIVFAAWLTAWSDYVKCVNAQEERAAEERRRVLLRENLAWQQAQQRRRQIEHTAYREIDRVMREERRYLSSRSSIR